MTDLELARALRSLRRTTHMLETELRHGRLDDGLLADIESHMERGIAGDSRCTALVTGVDNLRENTLTPRPERVADTIRACEKLKDAIEGVTAILV
ncbi:MAG: hypothetical protein IPJ87_03390 [Flavobacteriales bacterium]|nr:hypothetical protein [Flavobacteriales bacterium]MBK7940910.1 hypothetical protein [Flavobacteriales bacterium]MBK8948440.1 hypothetical protein [Flavobacteriales bacterium]MBK9701667.1 hypothetical protein [Flavobacteriales bacterium]